MKKHFQKAAVICVGAAIISTPSCTQRQVGKAAVVAAVGTAIGAAVILDDANRQEREKYRERYRDRGHYGNGHRHSGYYGHGGRHPEYYGHGGRHPGYYGHGGRHSSQSKVCRSYRNYHGDLIQDCRSQRRSGRMYFKSLASSDYLSLADAIMKNSVSNIVDPLTFAEVNKLSVKSSELVLGALDKAKVGDLSGLEAIGLDERSLIELADLKLPSKETIDRIAKNLDQHSVYTKGMFTSMLDKTLAFIGDVDSGDDFEVEDR